MPNEKIVVLSGPLQGKEFDLESVVTIGRNPDNKIALDDRQVSRYHATIESTPTGTILKDLSSGNGTFVDNRRILQIHLSNEQVFRVGSVDLKYVGEPAAMPMPAAPKADGDSGLRFQDMVEGKVQATSTENVYQTLFASAPSSTGSAAEVKSLQNRLAAIYKANQIISSENNLSTLFGRVLEQVFVLVPANNGVILLKDDKTKQLKPAYQKAGSGQAEITVSTTIVRQAYEDGQAVLVRDAADDKRFDASASIMTGNIASAMCVPLTYQGEKLGVIYVDTRGTTNAFSEPDLELIVALSGPSAIAIKNAQFVEELQEDFRMTLRLLANAIELRDHYTVGHTWRVTNFSLALAAELGWDEEKLKIVEMGGVLHDVGKIAVPDAVLCKPDKLTNEEYAQMKIHPERGADLMKDSRKLRPLIPYCLYHHERYDGKGYPKGLAGEDIPIEGRLVAVADTFDAMTSNRPYRKGLNPEIAIAELEKNKLTQFDPDCVDAFVRAYRAGKINHILQAYHENEKSIVCPFCSTFIPIPEGAELGTDFECRVCHRKSRLAQINDAYHGVLLSDADTQGSQLTPPSTKF